MDCRARSWPAARDRWGLARIRFHLHSLVSAVKNSISFCGERRPYLYALYELCLLRAVRLLHRPATSEVRPDTLATESLPSRLPMKAAIGRGCFYVTCGQRHRESFDRPLRWSMFGP